MNGNPTPSSISSVSIPPLRLCGTTHIVTHFMEVSNLKQTQLHIFTNSETIIFIITVECSVTVRSSNLQLSSAHNRRISKTEGVYLTSFPRTTSFASRLFLRSCRQYTLADVYLDDMWLSRCGDHTVLLFLHWQQYCAVWLWDNTTAFTLVNQYSTQIINH
jgi:hypothetical protein